MYGFKSQAYRWMRGSDDREVIDKALVLVSVILRAVVSCWGKVAKQGVYVSLVNEFWVGLAFVVAKIAMAVRASANFKQYADNSECCMATFESYKE